MCSSYAIYRSIGNLLHADLCAVSKTRTVPVQDPENASENKYLNREKKNEEKQKKKTENERQNLHYTYLDLETTKVFFFLQLLYAGNQVSTESLAKIAICEHLFMFIVFRLFGSVFRLFFLFLFLFILPLVPAVKQCSITISVLMCMCKCGCGCGCG